MSETSENDSTRTLVKREIKLIGDTSSCPACDTGNQFFSAVKKPNVEYKYIDIKTPEGSSIAENKNMEYMPHIEDCKTFDDGTTKCQTKDRFVKEDWKDLGNESTTTEASTS